MSYNILTSYNQKLILTPELRAEMLQAVKTSTFVQAKVEEAKKVLKQIKKIT